MKILVTGGAGFIGSHLMEYLLKKGDDAEALDNLRTGRRENLPRGAKLIEADVLSKDFDKTVSAGKYDAIVHLAGQTLVTVSIERPDFDTEQNIGGIVRVLEAARKSGVPRVIFASTAAAYGDVPESALPAKETLSSMPLSFYGLSKLTSEKYLALYSEIFNIEYFALRFANVYGERQTGGGEGGVVSIFSERIARGDDISIFGDGKQTRDFIYAGDIARGIGAALTAKKANTVCNLSAEKETSLLQLVEIFKKISGKNLSPKFMAPREGDIVRSALSNEKARALLGWQPETELETGLRKTYEYFRGIVK